MKCPLWIGCTHKIISRVGEKKSEDERQWCLHSHYNRVLRRYWSSKSLSVTQARTWTQCLLVGVICWDQPRGIAICRQQYTHEISEVLPLFTERSAIYYSLSLHADLAYSLTLRLPVTKPNAACFQTKWHKACPVIPSCSSSLPPLPISYWRL